MSTYEISKSSLLSLKAEILRKQQELVKAKADNEVKIKIIKKNTPLEIKNKGVDSRQKNDITEEEADLLKQSKTVLEAKSKLYDRLSSGKLSKEEIEHNKRFLVRFDKKNKSTNQNPSPIDFEDPEPEQYPESDEERYHSDEDDDKEPGEKWVDYVDCLGRTRKCLQKDLDYLMSKDEDLKKAVEAKTNNKPSGEEQPKQVMEEIEMLKDNRDENLSGDPQSQEAQLLSNDMRRELLRQQWEKEEDELRNKSNIHYQDILFGEARTHGVGYYGFSKDEEERAKQQEALKKLRDETEAKQRRAQELKALREKQLAARIKAAKNRRRARLGLPPEEDVEPEVAQPEMSEEEKKKEEKAIRQNKETERLLEEARKTHIRPWDVGKEGVKKHYEMTQDEWVDKKRSERPTEFAPPQIYNRKFRSAVKISNSEETDKSLTFSTKESHRFLKKIKNRKHNYSNTGNDYINIFDKTKDIQQSVSFQPTPIENFCDDVDIDDPQLSNFNKGVCDSKCADSMNERRGVEIPPPPTFDYYGPSSTKKPRFEKAEVNIQNSIEAGLKFLRKQVEDKQQST